MSQNSQIITAPYIPFEWQKEPWAYKGPVLLCAGTSNTGKSHFAAEKMHGFMLHYPGACGVILRKAREWCSGSVVQMLKAVIGDDPRVQYIDHTFRYQNGSVIYVAGLKDKNQREALRSKRGVYGEPDIAWMEEANAFSKDDFQEVFIRVRGKRAGWTQVIITTNPDAPTHWIYTDLIQGGGAKVYQPTIDDNERATQADRDRLDSLTGVMRLRMRDGRWVQAEGAIYDEFNPAIHMIDFDKVPKFVKRYRTIDFGFIHPFICQWWGEDADGNLYRYREIYKTRTIVEDHTKAIIRYSLNEKFEFTVADHDAEDRATMERHGIKTVPALKDVKMGIQEVKSRMKVQENKKPRIYLVRGALVEIDQSLKADNKPTCTEEEIPGYIWKPNKEEPVKEMDDGVDAMRYLVMTLAGKPKRKVAGAR